MYLQVNKLNLDMSDPNLDKNIVRLLTQLPFMKIILSFT